VKVKEGDVAAIRKDSTGGYFVSCIPDNVKVGDELPEDYVRVFSTRKGAQLAITDEFIKD
jgi:hypothetical protein